MSRKNNCLHSFIRILNCIPAFVILISAEQAHHLLKNFVEGFHHGITVTCPGFYGPQGRILRLGIRNPELIDRLTQFNFGQHRISNFEMETSGIYGLGKLLGHHCLSLSAIVANRIQKQFSKDSQKTDRSIDPEIVGYH